MSDEGYTQSEIGTFKACRYKWYLSYVLRVTPKIMASYFEDGGAFHDAQEDRGNGVDMEQIGLNIRENYKGFIANYKGAMTPEIIADYDKRMAMVQGMVAGYEAVYPRDEFEIIECEDQFKVELDLKDGTTAFIRGKKDKKVMKDGEPWLVEHKTSSVINATYKNKLPMDQQTLTYSWADWKQHDEVISGVVYDVIKKPTIRQKKAESREDFLNRLRQSYIDGPEKHFFREDLKYSKKQLIKFEKKLITIIKLMRKAEENPKEEVYRNEGACSDFGGCMYKEICRKQSLKGFHMNKFFKREGKHQELDDDK